MYCYGLLTIQLNISHLFKYQVVLFNQLIGPYQVLPLRDRVDLGAMAVKEYSAFPKSTGLLEPTYHRDRDIGPAVRVFANGPGDLGSIPGRVIPKTLKMVLDTTLLNTQHYKVRFKGKVEQSWEWSSALPYTLV